MTFHQRCSSRLKSCRCRTAMVYKLTAAAPLPRWLSKKCSKFHCRACIGPEILVLDHQIHSVSWCFIFKHWNSTKFMQFFNVLEKNAAAAASPPPRWFFPKPTATAAAAAMTSSKTCRNRRHGHFCFPRHFDYAAKQLLRKLLNIDQQQRLDPTKNGGDEIKHETWFNSITSWQDVYDRWTKPSYQPTVSNLGDTTNFDVYDETDLKLTPPATKYEVQLFKDF